MGSLVKLTYLDMRGINIDELPKEILPKLSHLQYLNLPRGVNSLGEDLASLELLEDFEGWFSDLPNFNKFMRNRRNYERDWRYDIFVGQGMSASRHDDFGNSIYKQRRVIVEDCTIVAGGGDTPASIILPHCIQILHITNCLGLSSCLVDNFLSGTTLRGLTCINEHCDDVEWIVNVPSGRNITRDPHCIRFHSLLVHRLRNLVGLCKGKISSHTFSGLTELSFFNCHKMKKLFPRAIVQDLKNLEKLGVSWCDEMEEIIAEEATDKEGSSQRSNPQKHLITSTSGDLPKLKVLYLGGLPKLKRICEVKLICDSLESMTCLGCHKLKRMPFYTSTTNGHPFPCLREIYVEEYWLGTLEWDQSYVKTLFQPYLHYFRSICFV